MKRKLLLKKLRQYGWYFEGHGANHDHWTNGIKVESVPRHNDIEEYLAKKIIKVAKNNPPNYGI